MYEYVIRLCLSSAGMYLLLFNLTVGGLNATGSEFTNSKQFAKVVRRC